MYLIARGWGIAPPHFWSMTLHEFLAELRWRDPQNVPGGKYAGRLTQADVERLMKMEP